MTSETETVLTIPVVSTHRRPGYAASPDSSGGRESLPDGKQRRLEPLG